VTTWQITFSDRFNYSQYDDLIFPIALSSDIQTQILVRVKLDTGSTFCVFQPSYAELLEIEIEKGNLQRIRTATGSFTAYGHEITMIVGELEWQAVVYFAEDEFFPVNVVGRVGFLDRLKIGLVDYEQLLYLSACAEVWTHFVFLRLCRFRSAVSASPRRQILLILMRL